MISYQSLLLSTTVLNDICTLQIGESDVPILASTLTETLKHVITKISIY